MSNSEMGIAVVMGNHLHLFLRNRLSFCTEDRAFLLVYVFGRGVIGAWNAFAAPP